MSTFYQQSEIMTSLFTIIYHVIMVQQIYITQSFLKSGLKKVTSPHHKKIQLKKLSLKVDGTDMIWKTKMSPYFHLIQWPIKVIINANFGEEISNQTGFKINSDKMLYLQNQEDSSSQCMFSQDSTGIKELYKFSGNVTIPLNSLTFLLPMMIR